MAPKQNRLLAIKCGPNDDAYLVNEEWKSLKLELEQHVTVIWAQSPAEVITQLSNAKETSQRLVGVLAMDAGFTSNQGDLNAVTGALSKYAKAGGTVVFAGVFPAVCTTNAMNSIFGAFQLQWSFGCFYNTAEVELNESAGVFTEENHLSDQKAEMPTNFQFSTATVKVKDFKEVLYKSNAEQGPTAVAVMKKVGAGYVAFVGSRENVEPVRKIILAMFKLLVPQ